MPGEANGIEHDKRPLTFNERNFILDRPKFGTKTILLNGAELYSKGTLSPCAFRIKFRALKTEFAEAAEFLVYDCRRLVYLTNLIFIFNSYQKAKNVFCDILRRRDRDY